MCYSFACYCKDKVILEISLWFVGYENNISYSVITSQCPVLLLPTYLTRCISRIIYNSHSTLRWFKLFIAMVKVNHRNVLFYLPYSFILKPIATLYAYYDAKNEIHPRPPTWIFWKKIELFYYCYNLYIYNLFNRAHFVSYFVSGFVSDFSDTEKHHTSDL